MSRKIVLIGAGSVVFTQGLVSDLVRASETGSWRLSLVDTDPTALNTAARISRKMIDARKADVELSFSPDRRQLLSGADYVVTTIGVGGRRAWEEDVFIPRKYGVFQPVGDSVMPGGISRAMRMIPAMLDIVSDIEELCPAATLFNYSNPMTYICRAIRKKTGFPVVGLCHGVQDSARSLAGIAGFGAKELSWLAVGLNHLTFIYDLRYQGKEILSEARRRVMELRRDGIDYSRAGRQFTEKGDGGMFIDPFAWELFSLYGAYPAPGDRHITEYFAERFPQGSYYGKTLGVDAFSFEDTIAHGDRTYSEMGELAGSDDPLTDEYFRRVGGEHEFLLDMIDSIETDARRTYSANLPNAGAVPNLPYETVVELPVAATARGLRALHSDDFPDTLSAIISRHAAIAEVVVDAALRGDTEMFVEAIMMGGYIHDRDAVRKMVHELLQAHARYLPQFRGRTA